MQSVVLNNGITMPMIGFGTYKLLGEDCKKAVFEALRVGYRMIDTAESYGNEAAIGSAIAEYGISREELFLTTKVKFRSYEHARASVENSLINLQTDYLDLVLLHYPFGNYYSAYRELEEMHQEGMIRAIGISNFPPDRMIDLLNFNRVLPAVNQIETHVYCQRKVERKWLKKYNILHQAYSPLGMGLKNEMLEEPILLEIAQAHGKTPAQIALRFLLQDGIVIIPKSGSPERIRDNFNLYDFSLSPDEMEALRTLDTGVALIGKPEQPERVELAMTW